jgi:hypothetical protein
VHERGRGDRMEAKGGIVYSKPVTVSKNRRRLLDKQTYAGVEGVDAFGEKLARLAARQGAYKAKQLFFVSDGSTILRQMRAAHFPTAVYFLDVWHLEYRLAAALGEVGRDDLPPRVSLALEGKVDALIARLSELWAAASQDDDRRKHLGELIAYVDSNREGLRTTRAMAPSVGRDRKGHGCHHWPPTQGQGHVLVPTWCPPPPTTPNAQAERSLEPVLGGPTSPDLPSGRPGGLMCRNFGCIPGRIRPLPNTRARCTMPGT